MDELTNKLLERSDLDAERMFLTSLILDPSGFEQHEALLPDEAFYSEAHRKIYAAARAVHRATGCADAHLIAMHARDNGWREAPLAVAGLLTEGAILDSMTFCSAYLAQYARRVRKTYVEREKGRATREYQASTLAGMDEHEARVILDSLLDALDAMDPPSIDARDVAELIGGASRQPTGYREVDAVTRGGFTRPGLNIIAARPSVGKSALARGIIRHAAQAGQRVFWYSGDQSLPQIYQLEIAAEKRSGNLRIEEWELDRRVAAVEHIKSKVWRDRVVLIDDPLTLPQLTSLARASRADLVVIDYLQLVDSGVKDEREYEAVTRVSKALKALALEMNVAVVALAQLNREVNPNEAPSLNQLRASGQIEQDADQVWGLQRDTSLTSSAPAKAVVHILKNKSGPTGTVPLTWIGAYATFEDYASERRYA